MNDQNRSTLPETGSNGVNQSLKVPANPLPEPLFYTIPQAAAALGGVCTKTVRRLIARGKLTCCKHLRKKLIPRQQIEDFVKKSCDKPNH